MEALLAVLLVASVAAFVAWPLVRSGGDGEPGGAAGPGEPRAEALATRKEALYREIRDLEVDHAAGKMDDEDFRRADRELRAQAIEILKEIERIEG